MTNNKIMVRSDGYVKVTQGQHILYKGTITFLKTIDKKFDKNRQKFCKSSKCLFS